jgi:putative transport protein
MLIDLLLAEPLLRLFLVAGIGYLVGRVNVLGLRLGVAAVLFVGLALGSLDPGMGLPEIVQLLGLCLFVYTFGLASGEVFFASLRSNGLRDNLFVTSLLVLGGVLTFGLHRAFGLDPARTAGAYCGSLTCTPALAAVVQTLRESRDPAVKALESLPVIGYSLAYPVSVLGSIALMAIGRKVWRPDDRREAVEAARRGIGTAGGRLVSRTVKVSNPLVVGLATVEIQEHSGIDVVFGRHKRDGQIRLVGPDTRLALGDLVTLVGAVDQVDRAMAFLGEPCDESLQFDRREYDYRRVFVSSPRIAGRTLAQLDLSRAFGAVVTRLQRGDVELVPHDTTRLELGDRLRIVCPHDRAEAVTRFFGDSYRAVSEIDVMGLGLGIALGLLLGMIPITIPGLVTFKLGVAGGPLLVALVLGNLRRTGPLVWSLPYGANLTLRQLGLILFLAGVGTRSGHAFASTLRAGNFWPLLAIALVVTLVVAGLTLVIGYKVLRIPYGQLQGLLAGLQTQTALLAYAQEQARNDLPNVGYATIYPMAVIVKIVIAQILLTQG